MNISRRTRVYRVHHRVLYPLLATITLGACSDGTESPGGTTSESGAPASAAANAEPPASAIETGISLPAGFRATVFADDLDAPRHIAVRDNGDVYLTLRNDRPSQNPDASTGGLVALRDTNGDGVADMIERFGRGDGHTGMAIRDSTLYYSSTTAIYAIELGNGLVPAGQSELVVGGFGNSGDGHSAKPIALDDEGHLYAQAGVPSNACQQSPRTPGSPGVDPCPQLEQFGGVWRFSASSRGQDQLSDGIRFSTGHRNAVALEWSPVSNELYLAMHGRDQLDVLFPEHYSEADRVELPAEEFHVLAQGDDLGWPYTYYDPMRGERMVSPEYGGDGETPAEPGQYKDPLIGFPAHWAPNDLLFYTGDQFPERYHGGAFIAFHGSWNRAPAPQGGYAVVFVPMQDGRPSGDWEIFADDFEGDSPVTAPGDARYRPTGLAEGPDGSLYITDDESGHLWKVMYTGG